MGITVWNKVFGFKNDGGRGGGETRDGCQTSADGVQTIAKVIMLAGFSFSKMVALCKVIAKGVKDGATNA